MKTNEKLEFFYKGIGAVIRGLNGNYEIRKHGCNKKKSQYSFHSKGECENMANKFVEIKTKSLF